MSAPRLRPRQAVSYTFGDKNTDFAKLSFYQVKRPRSRPSAEHREVQVHGVPLAGVKYEAVHGSASLALAQKDSTGLAAIHPYDSLSLFGRVTRAGEDNTSHEWYVGQGDQVVVDVGGEAKEVVLLGFARKKGKAYHLLCHEASTGRAMEVEVQHFLRMPTHPKEPQQTEAREWLAALLHVPRGSAGMVVSGLLQLLNVFLCSIRPPVAQR